MNSIQVSKLLEQICFSCDRKSYNEKIEIQWVEDDHLQRSVYCKYEPSPTLVIVKDNFENLCDEEQIIEVKSQTCLLFVEMIFGTKVEKDSSEWRFFASKLGLFVYKKEEKPEAQEVVLLESW